jgi:anaerobic magnesium-protoporphyrin IX monomethyl ester cyclase
MEIMKVLLVQPAATDRGFIHLGLAYIGACLEARGHEIKILDLGVEGESKARILNCLRKVAPDVVGITTLTPTYPGALRVAALVKEMFPRCPIILGGTHASVLTDEVLRERNVDFVVRGEGEITMPELLNAIEAGRGVTGVPGVSYKDNGAIIHNPPRAFIENLDSLPSTPWHLFTLERYTGNLNGKKAVGLSAARGCPFNCVFCYRGPAAGDAIRMWSPQRIIQEVQSLRERYGIRAIHFWNDVFTYDRRWVESLCDLIDQDKIEFEWDCQTRADLINEQVLRKMKKAGCTAIMLGVESGSDEVLSRTDKKLTREQIRESFRLLQEIGFQTTATFTLGLPWDTKATIRETIDFAKEINPDFAMFYVATPFPGSELWNILERRGIRLSRDWANYRILPFEVDVDAIVPAFDTSALSKEDLKGFIKVAQIEFQLGRMRGGRKNLLRGLKNTAEIFKLVFRRTQSLRQLCKLLLRVSGDFLFAIVYWARRRRSSPARTNDPAK